MKKTIILSAVLVSALAFASCKKARTCSCTSNNTSTSVATQGGVTVTGTPQVSSSSDTWAFTDKMSKKESKRKTECFDRTETAEQVSSTGSGSNKTTTTTTTTREIKCELK